MKRTIERWEGCRPYERDSMIGIAFQDAKADILELHAENLILKQWIVECRDQLLYPLSHINLDEPGLSLTEISQTATSFGESTVALLADK